jgi:hypothetical protein
MSIPKNDVVVSLLQVYCGQQCPMDFQQLKEAGGARVAIWNRQVPPLDNDA